MEVGREYGAACGVDFGGWGCFGVEIGGRREQYWEEGGKWVWENGLRWSCDCQDEMMFDWGIRCINGFEVVVLMDTKMRKLAQSPYAKLKEVT